ncbi:PIN domain-containing protein [Pectobacterium versatile]|uniref:PIN domain-containing protein n=1 Tax=Pectobacterium versatile TaxID=2488639 RepID=UPI001F2170A9|nr:PIN domain-containing protein [Pectobacterium versatile]
MNICIDTNIFFDNFYIKSTNLKLILNFINNAEHVLLLPDVVLMEIESHFTKGRKEAVKSLDKAIREYNKFVPIGYEDSLDFFIECNGIDNHSPDQYSFLKEIKKHIAENRVIILHSMEVSHEIILEKLINNKKPFKENGVGYKDVLIWLSFINYIKNKGCSGDVFCFLSENIYDFSHIKKEKKDEGVDFHPDLKSDLEKIDADIEVNYCESIKNLIKNHSISNDVNHTSFEEVKRYIQNDLGYDLSENINLCFSESKNEIYRYGNKKLDLLSNADNVFFNIPCETKFEISQLITEQGGILCRCALSYENVEITAVYSNIESELFIKINALLPNAKLDEDDGELILKLTCSLTLDVTFKYIGVLLSNDVFNGRLDELDIQSIDVF